jgi:hypothetical protein
MHVHHDQHYTNTSHFSSILHSSMLDLQSNLNKVRYKIHSPNKEREFTWISFREGIINEIIFTPHLISSTLFSLLGDYFFTQHRETLLVENAELSMKVFSTIHIYGHELSTLPVGVILLYFQQEQSFSVRARVSLFYNTFSIVSFYFYYFLQPAK